MWKCPKCNREFLKINQMHSCKVYPLKKHFENKKEAKKLYDQLLSAVKKEIGPFKVESLSCCIHLVDCRTKITYFCVYPLKDRLKLHISSDKILKSSKAGKFMKIGSKYKYEIFARNEKDLDKELIDWLKESNKK